MKIYKDYKKREIKMKWEGRADRATTIVLCKFFPQEFREIYRGAIYHSDNDDPNYTRAHFKKDFYTLYNAISNLITRLGVRNEN